MPDDASESESGDIVVFDWVVDADPDPDSDGGGAFIDGDDDRSIQDDDNDGHSDDICIDGTDSDAAGSMDDCAVGLGIACDSLLRSTQFNNS